jgi:lysozyme
MKWSRKTKRLVIRTVLIGAGLYVAFTLGVKLTNWATGLIRTAHRANVSRKTDVKVFSFELPPAYNVHGIDISKHQKSIDWLQVGKSEWKGKKLSFVFIKASEGSTRPDELFVRNWSEAKKQNLLRGAYHFYRPAKDANEQFILFSSIVKLEKGDLPPVVDIEVTNRRSKKVIQAGLLIFMKKLEAKYHARPIIYTSQAYYNRYLADKFSEYPVWIAWYKEEDSLKAVLKTNWHFWQHSDQGNVNGIKGKVDFNVFSGDLNELKKMCIK